MTTPLPLLSSAVCAAAYFVAVWSHYWLVPDPRLSQPVLAGVLGRFTFLTFQTNVLCCVYYALAVASALGVGPPLDGLLARAFPVAFTLGAFLTPGYYGLDHFNVQKKMLRKQWIERGYPYVTLGAHLTHGHSLPAALIAVLTVETPHAAEDVLMGVGGFTGYYICLIFANKMMTGEYVYPFLTDAQAKRGFGLVAVILAVIWSVVVAIGFMGRAVVVMRLGS